MPNESQKRRRAVSDASPMILLGSVLSYAALLFTEAMTSRSA